MNGKGILRSLNIKNVSNEKFRKEWIEKKIGEAVLSMNDLGTKDKTSVLDVGAGLSPFKQHILLLGANYFSHDFNQYVPSNSQSGLQDIDWDYPSHNFNCDVLLIPTRQKFEILLCTEVLEHVPDPVSVLKKLYDLTSDQGFIIITVPFLSLKHQAPYWFSSGLSDHWFEYWSKELNLKILDLSVSGDYVDLLSQEIYRLFNFKYTFGIFSIILSKLVKFLRPLLSNDVLTSGGFNTLFIAQKI